MNWVHDTRAPLEQQREEFMLSRERIPPPLLLATYVFSMNAVHMNIVHC